MKKSKMKVFFIALVAFLLIVSMAACGNNEPAATPETLPGDTPAASEDTPEPAPPAEPAAVPGRVLPASWSDSKFFIFDPGLVVDVSADWIPSRDGEATVYNFSGNSDLPKLSLFYDYVSGIDDFDEFFDWWLAERFNNPEYNPGAEVIRQEYVTYNGIKCLEINYIDGSDGTLRHALYTFVDRTYFQVRFAFEPGGDASYLDDVAYVFNSIRKSYTEIDEWPTAYLPAGTPVYTDGGMIQGNAFISEDFGNIEMKISNTSADALSKFVDQMEKLGWAINYYDIIDGQSGGGSKGSWDVHMHMDEDGTTAVIAFFLSINEF